jgi:hypothetical protein
MNTKDTRGPQLERSPEIVVTRADRPDVDRPVSPTPAPAGGVAPDRSRLGRAVQLGLALGLVAAIAGGSWLAWGGDDGTDVTTNRVPAAAPAVVAPLTLQVEPPAAVRAGQPVELDVQYADGKGVFSGSTEDWGDGVGTSSLAQGRCPATDTPADPTSGSYQATHTWAEPGSYRVSIGVSSYTCVNGAPVEEQASTTVTVVVGP